MFAPPPGKNDRCRVCTSRRCARSRSTSSATCARRSAGIARVAEMQRQSFHVPEIGLRTGDTPQKERARLARTPPDILITTPESLFLVLTSNARHCSRPSRS